MGLSHGILFLGSHTVAAERPGSAVTTSALEVRIGDQVALSRQIVP